MKLETALLDAETEEDRQTRAKTEFCEFCMYYSNCR